jgi:predicted RNase H-like HicB family nuclease
MKQLKQLTCIIEREGDDYVSLCSQIDIVSQGDSVEEVRKNLIEVIELFFEMVSPQEILKLI